MSDGNLRSTWKWTLARYIVGPIAAVAIMAGLVTWNIANRTLPWKKSEPISAQFQTRPEGDAWRDYSDEELERARADGKTVLVDFVARWSLDSMENRVLLCRLPSLGTLIEQGKVVAMVADYTDRSPAITVALRRLKHDTVPVVAIYPPRDGEPTVLTGRLTGPQIADALAATRDRSP